MPSRVTESPDPDRRRLLAMAAMAPVLTVAGTAGAAQSAPVRSAKLPPDLAGVLNAYDQATISNDIATLERIVAEDYLLVNSDRTHLGQAGRPLAFDLLPAHACSRITGSAIR